MYTHHELFDYTIFECVESLRFSKSNLTLSLKSKNTNNFPKKSFKINVKMSRKGKLGNFQPHFPKIR